jgi:hypothetical protein
MIRDIVKNGVTENEVKLAKQNLEGIIKTNLDDNGSNCIHNGVSGLFAPTMNYMTKNTKI